jgi:hypothetical protein
MTTAKPRFIDNLADVPELTFRAQPQTSSAEKAREAIAHQLAKINHLNKDERDGFLKALLVNRLDLVGLPFQMGDHCRLTAIRQECFSHSVSRVREHFGELEPYANQEEADSAWQQYIAKCVAEDQLLTDLNGKHRQDLVLARIAALSQVVGPLSKYHRIGLARYLAGISHPRATLALAELVLYSPEAEVRKVAIEGLSVRREKDYTDTLLKGFVYPWPGAARHAAEALVQLKRHDLLPDLVNVLDQPDPRLPVARKDKDSETFVVREMVKINHHQNCMLCHAPGNTSDINSSAGSLIAEVPAPGQPFPSNSGYGSNVDPDHAIRIDVTYLRQDFSRILDVENAAPWPTMQRFDFVVQTREVSDEDVQAWHALANSRQRPGYVSEYQRAALYALRELTGLDTTPTADAWRELLKTEKSH